MVKRGIKTECATDMAYVHRYRKKPILGDDMNLDMDTSKGRFHRVSPLATGSVQRHGEYGWRFQARISGNDYMCPFRRDKVDAKADMQKVKKAQTREEMKLRIREIKARVGARAECAIGSVQRHGEYGWRFQARIDGNNYICPYRRDKVDAKADMQEVKEAQTREEMKLRIREIKARVGARAE
jgi:hypothetical protein